MTMRLTKAEILQALECEDRSYRLGLLCTHWIRDVERYAPSAASLARGMSTVVDKHLISDADLCGAPGGALVGFCPDILACAHPGPGAKGEHASQAYEITALVQGRPGTSNTVPHNFHIGVGMYGTSCRFSGGRSRSQVKWTASR